MLLFKQSLGEKEVVLKVKTMKNTAKECISLEARCSMTIALHSDIFSTDFMPEHLCIPGHFD